MVGRSLLMSGGKTGFLVGLLWCLVVCVHADTVYVDVNSPVNGPGTAWTNAFQTIQDAVESAVDGDEILVTNGTYNTGGCAMPGQALTNRVCITNAVTVISVNGPEFTVIEGAGPMGDSAIRGVYMTAGMLDGFTVQNGHTRGGDVDVPDGSGGGIYMSDATITNCAVVECSALSHGGGVCAYDGLLSDCMLLQNLTEHTVDYQGDLGIGGGIYLSGGVLEHSSVISNRVFDAPESQNEFSQPAGEGGGIYMINNATVRHCTVAYNRSGDGHVGYFEGGNGGAGGNGGGIYVRNGGVVSNCEVRANYTGAGGDATEDLMASWAYAGGDGGQGGGIFVHPQDSNEVTIADCTVISNWTGHGGVSKGIEFDELSSGSGGHGGGICMLSTGAVIGCSVFDSWTGNGADGDGLYTYAGAGGNGGGLYAVDSAWIEDGLFTNNVTGNGGAPDGSAGEGGGGYFNRGFLIRAYGNRAGSGGGVRCRSIDQSVLSGNHAETGGGLRLIGGTASQCFISNNVATGSGGGVFLENQAVIEESTICDNVSSNNGGGLYLFMGGSVLDCSVYSNRARNGGGLCLYQANSVVRARVCSNYATNSGGGIAAYAMSHCQGPLLFDNVADVYGGGVLLKSGSSLNAATVAANRSSGAGGGIYLEGSSFIINTISYSNQNDDLDGDILATNCCAPGLSGAGNITNAPLFIDVSANDFQLQTNSACIDAGLSPGTTQDLVKTPRPLDGDDDGTALPDMGAYEFVSRIADTDGDLVTDYEEQVADTNPIDSNSYFHVTAMLSNTPMQIHFDSSSNRLYSIMYCTNLVSAMWTNVPGVTPRVGTGGADLISVSNAPPVKFYKLVVEQP